MPLVPVTLEQARLAQAAREPYRGLCADSDAQVIPWTAYRAFLEATAPALRSDTRLAGYLRAVRVMAGMLQWTGCRIKELERMRPDLLFGNALYWPIGKNQTGMRKEYLPDEYLAELAEYRRRNRVSDGQLFGIREETFTRYFNRYARPLLGPAWNARQVTVRNNLLVLDYALQLKGFRKNFQTIIFKRHWDRYGDAGVALEFTSKRMRHDSTHMTAYHYIQNFEALGIDEWLSYWRAAKISETEQTRLADYAEKKNSD